MAKHRATPRPARPHAFEEGDGAARAIAPEHEAQQENCGKKGTPENHGPAIVNFEETGNGATKAPDNGGARDEQNAAPPAAGVIG